MTTPSVAAATEARKGLRLARRVVIKAGTPMVTHVDGNIALGRIGALIEQVSRLRQEGRDVIVITSGAIATGSMRMRRTMTLNSTIQQTMRTKASGAPNVPNSAASAVGQALLMGMYEVLFSKYNLTCAQVLITEEDISEQETLSQVCDTTMELLQLGTVPIINDNDAVTSRAVPVYNEETSEVLWDNDILASRLAKQLRADLLISLTDLDSLYTAPADGGDGPPVRMAVYRDDAPLVRKGFPDSQQGILTDHGRGQFAGKTRLSETALKDLVEASRSAVAGGVRAAVITTGHNPLALQQIVRGGDIGTLFVEPTVRSSKL